MVIGTCAECKYIDLIEENAETICPRCSGRMISTGTRSFEWNILNNEEKQSRVDEAVSSVKPERAPASSYSEPQGGYEPAYASAPQNAYEPEPEPRAAYEQPHVSEPRTAYEQPHVSEPRASYEQPSVPERQAASAAPRKRVAPAQARSENAVQRTKKVAAPAPSAMPASVAPAATSPSGLSKGAIIAIAAGGAVLIGAAAFVTWRLGIFPLNREEQYDDTEIVSETEEYAEPEETFDDTFVEEPEIEPEIEEEVIEEPEEAPEPVSNISLLDGITAEDFNVYDLFNKDLNIEQTVIYDENDIRITADSISYGDETVDLNLTLENGTDKLQSFRAQTLAYPMNAVNGYMVEDGYLAIDVDPGQTVEDKISFAYDNLFFSGTLEIAEIQVGFDIGDEDYNEIYTGPLTVRTQLADSYNFDNSNFWKCVESPAAQSVYEYEVLHRNEEEKFNLDGVRVMSDYYMVNKDGERMLMLEVKNETDELVYFRTGHISVNGEEIYEYDYSSDCITGNKRMIVGINLDTVLERAELTMDDPVDSIGMTVQIYDEKMHPVSEKENLEVMLD